MSFSKICVAAACAAATATATAPKWHELTTAYTFEQYVEDFHKSYDAAEYARRKEIFEQKLKEILAHNAHAEVAYKMGVNQFTDMRMEDMPRNLELSDPAILQSANPTRMHVRSGQPLPKEVDWRKTPGVVAAVRNQGRCGNCWAHSAVESLESQWALKKGPLNQLSSQSMSDCRGQTVQTTTNVSCNGGWYYHGWESFMQRKGQSVPTEWFYPYHSIHGKWQDCQLPDHGLENTSFGGPAKVTGYVKVQANVEDIMDAVATVGPLSMALDAHWPGYEGGVYTGNHKSEPTWPCKPEIDHAVILDGYGTDNETGLDYWLIRNSWSAHWGENGYIRILRAPNATCDTTFQHGISLREFYYPLVE